MLVRVMWYVSFLLVNEILSLVIYALQNGREGWACNLVIEHVSSTREALG